MVMTISYYQVLQNYSGKASLLKWVPKQSFPFCHSAALGSDENLHLDWITSVEILQVDTSKYFTCSSLWNAYKQVSSNIRPGRAESWLSGMFPRVQSSPSQCKMEMPGFTPHEQGTKVHQSVISISELLSQKEVKAADASRYNNTTSSKCLLFKICVTCKLLQLKPSGYLTKLTIV